jgi:hypothetical protein
MKMALIGYMYKFVKFKQLSRVWHQKSVHLVCMKNNWVCSLVSTTFFTDFPDRHPQYLQSLKIIALWNHFLSLQLALSWLCCPVVARDVVLGAIPSHNAGAISPRTITSLLSMQYLRFCTKFKNYVFLLGCQGFRVAITTNASTDSM